MAIDKRSGGASPKWASRETTPGVKIDSGPFIGVIKNNADPSRQGRLQVWIPDLGGEEAVEANWYTVNYASPFFGSTQGSPGNTQGYGQQTYGFWAVPPDVNNLVLVTFVMGDASRGYWFACIPNTPTQSMVPGISRPFTNRTQVSNSFGTNRNIPSPDVYLPANEVNLESSGRDKDPNYLNLSRYIIDYQANIVCEQGLETDPLRGTVTSSSQRESPSQVVGISTPGRTTTDTADLSSDALNSKISKGKDGITIEELQNYPFRKGGHSFVMDDGDVYGDSRLLRLRSSGGHQILMHDSSNVMYISNSLGTSWIELTPKGHINIYSGDSVNIRSEFDLNFHADGNVNIHAGDTLKMYAGSTIHSQTKIQLIKADDYYNINAGVVGIKSGGKMDLQSISGSWQTSNLTNFNFGSFHMRTLNECVINSATNASTGTVSGWKSSGELWLKGDKVYLNTSGKVPITPSTPEPPDINPNMLLYKQQGVNFNETTKRWTQESSKFESIAPYAPTHEPWNRQTGALKNADGTINSQTSQG
jgi:hypothetical protein